jgi:putative membrane protein
VSWQQSLKATLKIIAKGFGMGAADVVPGVSGGTMALIFGIYTRLINAIKSFDINWIRGLIKFDLDVILHRPHFSFLIPLFAGIFTAILFFTRIIPLPVLIHTHPEIIYGLFFGLILGSVLVLMKETGSWSFKELRFVIVGIAIGHLIFNMVPVETPDASWFIFLSGVVAISAMILPGISGSFILLMLKKYAYIFNAIGHFNFAVIIPFAFGMITGLALFSRALSWLLKTWNQETLSTIIGLLVASLWVIWPFQERIYESIRDKERLIESNPYIPAQISADVNLSIAMVIAGLLLVLVLNHYSAGRSLPEEQ